MLSYFYLTDHLGSSSASTELSNHWITDGSGNAIQHLHYLPFGEDWVDQRNSSWNAPYTFSGKEKDAETGYGYFGARYYDSGLSIWLSVDPMSDKYPSMSPYNYCANNPVILVDPDGRRIFCETAYSRKAVTQYLNEHFGKGNPFKVDRNGNVVFNQRKYDRNISKCLPDQRILATGLYAAIRRDEICYVNIKENCSEDPTYYFTINHHFNENTQEEESTPRHVHGAHTDGKCVPDESNPGVYYVCMTEEMAKKMGVTTGNYETKTRALGKDDPIQETFPILTASPSANFFHEVCDEFLNFYTARVVTAAIPILDQLLHQNAAFRNLGLLERDGSDH